MSAIGNSALPRVSLSRCIASEMEPRCPVKGDDIAAALLTLEAVSDLCLVLMDLETVNPFEHRSVQDHSMGQNPAV